MKLFQWHYDTITSVVCATQRKSFNYYDANHGEIVREWVFFDKCQWQRNEGLRILFDRIWDGINAECTRKNQFTCDVVHERVLFVHFSHFWSTKICDKICSDGCRKKKINEKGLFSCKQAEVKMMMLRCFLSVL